MKIFNILVAESESNNSLLIGKALSPRGDFYLYFAEDVKSVFEIARSINFDLVITNTRMVESSSLSFYLKNLRDRVGSNVPLVVHSGDEPWALEKLKGLFSAHVQYPEMTDLKTGLPDPNTSLFMTVEKLLPR